MIKKMNYTLHKISKITNGKLYGRDSCAKRVLTDSRAITDANSALFVALTGKHRNGAEYIEDAHKQGVEMFLVSKLPQNWEQLGSFIVVNSTLEALQELAKWHRNSYDGEVIAITGSNGKTIVKEWFTQLWNREKYGKITRSPRSYNSQLGVALSLLNIEGDEQVVVIEAGISQCGEMERLERMIRPTLGVITNIGDAHSENFSSKVQKLDEKLQLFKECAPSKIVRGDQHIVCSTIEEHNRWVVKQIYSTLGLEPLNNQELQPLALRLEVQQGLHNSTIINDSYSNDLTSLEAALDFAHRTAKGEALHLILTDIEQNDKPSELLYSEVTKLIEQFDIESIIAIGTQIENLCKIASTQRATTYIRHYRTTEEYLQKLDSLEFANSTLLIKGARSFKTERISSRLEMRTHTTTLEINLSKVVENLKKHQVQTPPKSKVIAMVKASGYGLGSTQIAKTVLQAGASHLAVAFGDEGISLRKDGITAPIIALNADPGALDMMIQHNIEPEIYSFESLEQYINALKRRGIQNAPIHLKLDTGMHRLGFTASDIERLCETLNSEPSVRVSTILSHLAAADDPSEDEFTLSQIRLFEELSTKIASQIGYNPLLTLANSAGTMRFPCAHFDMVRIGIGLYQNCATLATKITQIKRIPKGESIGYNRREVAQQDMLIAIIPIGYADGLDRGLSQRVGKVRVAGEICDIIGNICMDMTIIDITNLDGKVSTGDRVEVMGGGAMSENQIAELLGTIGYEILTSISSRIKRLYIW